MRKFPNNLSNTIEEVLAQEWVPNRLIYECVYNRFPPLQRKNELRAMLEVAKLEKPKTVMEVGPANGGGLAHWCMALNDTVERVIACDLRDVPYKSAFEKAFPHIQFLWLSGGSRMVGNVKKVNEWLGKHKINVLFLDGDKNHFSADFATYLPLVNGVVFFHDIQHNKTQSDFEGRAKVRPKAHVRILDTTESFELVMRAREHEQETGEPYKPKNSYESWLLHWRGKGAGVGVIWHKGEKK